MVCGNLTLSADTVITGNEVIVVENGYLDLAGHNFTTSGTGAGVTIIFHLAELCSRENNRGRAR